MKMNKNIRDFISLSEKEKHEYVKHAREKVAKNEFNEIAIEIKEYSKTNNNGILGGAPYLVKDNFATQGIISGGGTNILKNFKPNYDAKIVELLNEAGALPIGKSNLDELAMGGTGLWSANGFVYNPWSKLHITGGSSSGSAAAVASGYVPFALGSDTGDSIRKPAAFCGVVGFKPSYGIISRYGLYPYAPSLDTAGFFTRSVEDAALLLNITAKPDHRDASMNQSYVVPSKEKLLSAKDNKKIAVFKEIYACYSDEEKKLFKKVTDILEKDGYKIEFIEFGKDLLRSVLPVYSVISFAEACSSLANLSGIHFGDTKQGNDYKETMFNSRTVGLQEMVKRRFAIGAYGLLDTNQKELFLKAKKIRRLLVDKFNKVLKDYACFLTLAGTTPITIEYEQATSWKVSDLENIFGDILVLANFNGAPSITIPCGFENKLPIGVNFTSAIFEDEKCLTIAKLVEDKLDYKDMVAGDKYE